MITPTTVSEAFIRWMETNGFGNASDEDAEINIYLNQIPDDAPDNAWWIVTGGGEVSDLLVTKESVQQFVVQVFYRDKSGEVVEHDLFALNQRVNKRGWKELEGFDLYSIQADMPEDNDKDVENRPQGTLSVAIQIYVS